DVTYRLEATGVTIEFRLENRGARAMPFALGLHPGFAWPFGGGMVEDYAIRFDQHEVPLVPCITTDGLFAAAHRRLDFDGRDLPLTRQLLAQEALCFLDAKSHRLCFLAPDGEAIAVEWENFAHVALWSRPPAPFLCVECWTGHGDPADFDGELAEKPSMRLLDPGDVSEHAVRWRLGKPPCP